MIKQLLDSLSMFHNEPVKAILHGVDFVDVSTFDHMIQSPRYRDRCYTLIEQEHCKDRADKYATRFAAKEAVLKALGIGIDNGVSLKDVEVTFTEEGIPNVRLSGVPAEVASRLGVTSWLLSFAQSGDFAIASVIATGT